MAEQIQELWKQKENLYLWENSEVTKTILYLQFLDLNAVPENVAYKQPSDWQPCLKVSVTILFQINNFKI